MSRRVVPGLMKTKLCSRSSAVVFHDAFFFFFFFFFLGKNREWKGRCGFGEAGYGLSVATGKDRIDDGLAGKQTLSGQQPSPC